MRPDRDEWFLRQVAVVAERATCLRRRVGCILANERGQALATGYNGVAAGLPHCNEPLGDERYGLYPHACAGAKARSGLDLDGCEAIHAEQNALLQCGDVYRVHTAYVSTSPCVTCVKLLLNTGCQRVVFAERYAHEAAARRLWEQARGPAAWVLLTLPKVEPSQGPENAPEGS